MLYITYDNIVTYIGPDKGYPQRATNVATGIRRGLGRLLCNCQPVGEWQGEAAERSGQPDTGAPAGFVCRGA